MCYVANVVIEKTQFVDNRGNGVWFDIGNEECVVRNCLIADNEEAGIFYEISYGLHAHDNVIIGNGFRETPGSWGAAAAMSLSSSPDCVIERNLIVGNREGFDFREQDRATPVIGDRKERRSGTTISGSSTTSWRSTAMPRCGDGSTSMTAATGQPPCRTAAGKDKGKAIRDRAKGGSAGPGGLTLEKLAITFDHNLYDARPGQGLFAGAWNGRGTSSTPHWTTSGRS